MRSASLNRDLISYYDGHQILAHFHPAIVRRADQVQDLSLSDPVERHVIEYGEVLENLDTHHSLLVRNVANGFGRHAALGVPEKGYYFSETDIIEAFIF